VLIQSRPYNSSHRWSAVADLHTSPIITIDIQQETGRCQINEAKLGSFYTDGKKHPSCTQNRALPTHHCTPDALRWRSRLALGVGEGQKQIRCIDSPVRRRGGVKRGEKKWGHFTRTGKSTPPAHRTGLFRPTNAFQMPSVGVPAGEGQKLTRCIDSPVRRQNQKWRYKSCTQTYKEMLADVMTKLFTGELVITLISQIRDHAQSQ
jgi:hypothetical protein